MRGSFALGNSMQIKLPLKARSCAIYANFGVSIDYSRHNMESQDQSRE